MIRDDTVDRTVLEPLLNGLHIVPAAQGGIDLGRSIKRFDRFLGKCKVMRRRFTAHPDPLGLGPADQLNGTRRAHMHEVNTRLQVTRQFNIARNNDRFRYQRITLQAQQC